jgi:signal transduction histidine kinase/CheY-like chemotaxis protein
VAAACSAAGRLAFRSFDNERALRFFEVALEALRLIQRVPELDFEIVMAEARLRTGALEAGCTQLRAVVARSQDPMVRAYALSRIAWAEMQSDTERAWAALREAFGVLGIRALSGIAGAALAPASALFRRPFRKSAGPLGLADRRRLAVICELYYQAARLAADTGKTALLAESVLKGLEPAERLGPSAALNKSYLAYSLLLTMLGARAAGRRYLDRAYEIARATRSPIVQAFTLQVHAMIAAWSGDLREALEIGARLLEEHGHWREIGDYCTSAYNQEQIESLRGRTLEGWKWLERAIGKLTKHEGPTLALDFVEVSARASLTALGREHEAERLLSRLGHLMRRPLARGNISMMAYGAHVRLFTENANLSPEFERLVAEVRAKKFDPRRVHLVMTEYYVHVAHARVHACLRAEPERLAERRGELGRALEDLKLAARLPLLKAHAAAIEGYAAFFDGALADAERLFARAELLGREEGAPWVLYAVHRGRAHALRKAGRADEARDQARLAEALAREHGAAYRLRWVREEFSLRGHQLVGSGELGSSSPPSPGGRGYSPSDSREIPARPRPRGYLRSLVRVGHCTAKELALDHQVRPVLDELMEALHADRGYLFLTRSRLAEEQNLPGDPRGEREPASERARASDQLVLAGSKGARGRELSDAGFDPKLVEDLWVFGSLDSCDDGGLPGVGTIASFADRAVVATPLVVRSGRLGVVYLDRPARSGPFSDADARLLAALAGQVPLVIELARSLRVRERVEETQRSAEKLEAIGRLAGGIAHDFNNMLSVILSASEQILARGDGHGVSDDVETIRSAAERARDLTRQLLAFSRGQYLNPEVLELNEVVRRLEPIFRRLGGAAITLEIRLDPELCRVKADPAQIDQVLTNLVVNACDAMPAGGKLSIETRSVVVSPPRSDDQALLPPGRYARVTVSDTGQGMDETTRAKAFEPFFTTKPAGSGLGLATAYGIVTQSGGHIELESQLGSGTSFRLYLPETVQRPSSMPAPAHSQRLPRGNETILLVDDEPLVRESTRRMLKSLGYKVITAKNSEEALKVAGEHLDAIDLVISDVIMPGMNGLELARELAKLRPGVRVLFVSGFTAGVLTERGVFRDTVEFLQKPVPLDTLATRIRAMVEPKRNEGAALHSKAES